jgi:hypothetical protein
MKKLVMLLAVIAMLGALVAVPARAQESTAPEPSSSDFHAKYKADFILVDVFILRPLAAVGFAASVVGAFVAQPLACSTNSQDAVNEELVRKPYDYTFKRPLGDIDF